MAGLGWFGTRIGEVDVTVLTARPVVLESQSRYRYVSK